MSDNNRLACVEGIDTDIVDAGPDADRPDSLASGRGRARRARPPGPSTTKAVLPIDGYSLPIAENLYKKRPRGAVPAAGNPARSTPAAATPTPHAPVLDAIDLAVAENTETDAAGQTETAEEAEVASEATPAPGAPPAAEAMAAWELIIAAYRDRPVEFAIDIIGVQPDPWQAEAMNRVAKGARRLTVRAGHGVGKSAFCAWLVIWQMVTRYPQKTVVTAPTQGQLFDALFSEIKSWVAKLPPPIRDLFEVQSERIFLKEKPNDSFVSAKTSSAERPEAMAGVHSPGWVLLIADEASAIPEQVFEAAAGSMSGFNACTILISNPTRNSGLFFATHHSLAEDWERMHVSCIGNHRVAPDFVKQIANTYGLDSNAYRVRVLGEFSLREDDVLIPAEWVDSAIARDIALDQMAPLVYGLDVARFGDDRTVLLKRQGSVVVEVKWWTKEDTMQTVGRVVNEARIDSPAEICVDSIGIGAGVADRLRELGYNARDVNVAESAAMNPQAARLRDDLWLQVKDWLGTRACKLTKDERLRQDLVAPTYGFNSSGKIVVEPKALMKKRRLPSPDYADALCLTFAGTAGMIGGRALSWIKGKPLKRNMGGVV